VGFDGANMLSDMLRMTKTKPFIVILNEGCRSKGSTRSDFCAHRHPLSLAGEDPNGKRVQTHAPSGRALDQLALRRRVRRIRSLRLRDWIGSVRRLRASLRLRRLR
jgi:hypothetical protein